MIDSEKFFKYLHAKIPKFEKTTTKGQTLFSCPNYRNHKIAVNGPTMSPLPGTDKFRCYICRVNYTMFDCVRTLEEDKKSLSDEQILTYLANSMKLDQYPELDFYRKQGWSLLSIAKNGKVPLEAQWTQKTHTDKVEWLKWLNYGYNIGVRTGEISKITVVDVDLKVAPTPELEEIYKQLIDAKTLIQNSPHGKHFIFKYDKELQTSTRLLNTTIDIRNDGAQILGAPSKINNLQYHWVDLGTSIKEIPTEIKAKLLSINKIEVSRNSGPQLATSTPTEYPKLKNNNLEGCCNDTFIRLGGIFIKYFTPTDTEVILNVFNTQLLETPIPSHAIKAMMGSLEGYKETEEESQEKKIYECCLLIQTEISAKDIMEHTGLKRAVVDKILAKFFKEGRLTRKGRGRYECKTKVEWTDEVQARDKEYQYKIPYFDNVSHFVSGDLLLLGAPSGYGKTTVAMNIIKQMKDQGVKPYYISLESGSRHSKIASKLELEQKDYFISKDSIDNPLQIELEDNAFTIIDWLYLGEDFAATLSIFKHLSDEIRKKGGILVVFTQLKEDYSYFATNLIKSFPSFSARFIYDTDDRLMSHWQVDKIRDPIGHISSAIIPCEFNFDTKLLVKREQM